MLGCTADTHTLNNVLNRSLRASSRTVLPRPRVSASSREWSSARKFSNSKKGTLLRFVFLHLFDCSLAIGGDNEGNLLVFVARGHKQALPDILIDRIIGIPRRRDFCFADYVSDVRRGGTLRITVLLEEVCSY